MNQPYFVLFSCPQMQPLAKRISSSPQFLGHPGRIEWDVWPDSWGHPIIKTDVRFRDVIFLAALESESDVFRQLAVIRELIRKGARSMTIILPFFSTGTMDRDRKDGEVPAAATLAWLFDSLPHCSGTGSAKLVVMDLHSLYLKNYFHEIILVPVSAIPILLHRLRKEGDNVVIGLPDKGAGERYGDRFHDAIQCEKERGSGDKRTIWIERGDPTGKHVVIVDDLSMTCGTLIACKDVLLKNGATKVSCFLSHLVCPEQSWKRLVGSGFSNVWFSDSCPRTVAEVSGIAPFEMLTLAPTIVDLLRELR